METYRKDGEMGLGLITGVETEKACESHGTGVDPAVMKTIKETSLEEGLRERSLVIRSEEDEHNLYIVIECPKKKLGSSSRSFEESKIKAQKKLLSRKIIK
jgi:hypothetical protein